MNKLDQFWKGERLNSGGNYNQNGLKIGIQIKLQENYWEYKLYLQFNKLSRYLSYWNLQKWKKIWKVEDSLHGQNIR
ncbi:unnamed protein product [Paramecium sonneborni]|uniref:Uncharacterized protein n=1 Tax=Paramecium sonneborni TaxID=65129 RepID=A0A8S1QI78_9CILI|nr:unnamed protein product [Paramecium sonneborni]